MSVLLQINGVDVEVADDDPRVPVPQPPQPVSLPDISDRQFYQQLAVMGMITQAEAIAAVGTGAIPSEMQSALTSLPAVEQFAATMKLTGATTFERGDPLVAVFAAAQNPPLTSAQLDALWQAAALL